MSYADDNVKQTLFSTIKGAGRGGGGGGGGRNFKINHPFCSGFKLIQDFIDVHPICKFQEHPIKTD